MKFPKYSNFVFLQNLHLILIAIQTQTCQLYHYLFQWNYLSGKQQGRTNEPSDPLKKSHKLHPLRKRNQPPKTKPYQEVNKRSILPLLLSQLSCEFKELKTWWYNFAKDKFSIQQPTKFSHWKLEIRGSRTKKIFKNRINYIVTQPYNTITQLQITRFTVVLNQHIPFQLFPGLFNLCSWKFH